MSKKVCLICESTRIFTGILVEYNKDWREVSDLNITVPSFTLFNKTTVDDFCELTSRQKSLMVFGRGLCVAMK